MARSDRMMYSMPVAMALEKPYRKWLDDNLVPLENVPAAASVI